MRPDTVPFWTPEYSHSMAATGHEVISLLLEEGLSVPGFVRRGRLGGNLLIPSLPLLTNPAEAGERILAHCRRDHLTTIDLPCFATPVGPLPLIARGAETYGRTEHLIDLRGNDDLAARLSRSHRQRAKQGRSAGLTVRRTTAPEALEEHSAMIGLSMTRRRSRGERVPPTRDVSPLQHYLLTSAGELFQAIADEEVVASMLVLYARAGAYDQSSGSSPTGMKIGAMHYLILETAQQLRSEGRKVLNLGGTRVHEEGLRAFKQAFGCLAVEVEAARWDLSGPGGRLVRRIAAVVRGARRALLPSASV
jgi:hypothetical protein